MAIVILFIPLLSLAISAPTELEFANIPCCNKCFSQRFQATTSWNSLPFILFQDVTRFHNNFMNAFSRPDLIYVIFVD